MNDKPHLQVMKTSSNVIDLAARRELDPYVDKRGLARHLSMSVPWIEKRMQHDNLPAHRVGKRAVRFKIREVEAWLREYTAREQ